MTEKVKLPQAVAEAITSMRDSEISDFGIVAFVSRWNGAEPDGAKVIRDWSFQNDSAGKLLSALVNGYEVDPEYKVGDWVARIDGKNIYPKGEIKVVEVFAGIERLGKREMVRHGTDGEWGIPVAQLRHATPKEIKAEQERRVWAGIGREVGEFRDGDFGEHVSGREQSESQEYLSDWYKRGRLKGFYPAESFISFEEVESNA
ncbi:hypothetical protein [Sporosarcina sp. FSL K6-1508]|uniref:hypothetical protein n=1 Tax=Sporosarcina sp. FSL K6-1508 TaxID=2921553 RepID=UPI0030FBB819